MIDRDEAKEKLNFRIGTFHDRYSNSTWCLGPVDGLAASAWAGPPGAADTAAPRNSSLSRSATRFGSLQVDYIVHACACNVINKNAVFFSMQLQPPPKKVLDMWIHLGKTW